MIGAVGFGYSLEQDIERLPVYGFGLSRYCLFPT